ncbi:hypothetical protein L218DRAFT_996597 [Marasmius fiardii PR-910]|nr:hypothetical protein L218DRAFT_996597 [Marasmius fiardii PR-910]
MATVVDLPQSALIPSTPTIPQRRPITDIIDVDLLDSDDEHQASRRVRSRREPSVEVIELSDDEDEEAVQIAGSSRGTRGRAPAPDATRLRNLNRLFSPPPRLNLTPTPIPPVPRLPQHLASHASLPMRRHPLPPSSQPHNNVGVGSSSSSAVRPPVRAHDRAFDFEDAFRGNGSGRSDQSSPTQPSGSRVSSRAPSPVALPPRLGLGGALISSNNARVAEERQMASRRRASAVQRAREHARARTLRAVARTNGHGNWDRDFGLGLGGFGGNRDQTLAHLYLELGLMPMEWPPGFLDPHPYQSKSSEVEYKADFTHPNSAEAGFTFDFAAGSSEDGGISSEGSLFPTTSAENPIIIDDDEDEDTVSITGSSSSGSKGKGIVVEASSSSPLSLRTLLVCSHCRDPLLLGESASKLGPEGGKARRIWSLRCGHLIDGKCLETLSIPSPQSTSSLEQVRSSSDADRKGKGKAVEPFEVQNDPEPSEYRSKLRSRRYMPPIPSFSSFMPSRRKVAVKEKENQEAVTIQETFEWKCPVGTCQKLHTSVRIKDVWGPAKPEMNKGDGVIGVFV